MNTPETDLHREVHGDLRAPGPEPVLLLAGFPMGGGGFRGLAERMSADRVVVTYERDGFGPAMAKFITLVMHDGELDEAYLQRPAPDPAQFGLPATDDGSRDDPLLAGSIRNGPSHQPDQTAIAAAADRILVAIGADSGGGLAARGARSAAEALGLRVVAFPDGHAGFADGEHGQTGSPDEFADRLREVLGPTL